VKRVFANGRDWRHFLSHIECGYTLQPVTRHHPRPAAEAAAEGTGFALAPRLEAMTAVFAENRRQ
jgi:hypothetical protein